MLSRVLALLLAAAPASASGPALFDAHGCRSCHKIGERGGNSGPDLTLVGHRRPKAWLEKWLASPRAWKHGTKMPEQGLSAGDRAGLAEFLSAQKGEAWGSRRPWDMVYGAEQGRLVYARAGCVACHGVRGAGGHPNPGGRGGWIPALGPLMGTYKKDELVSKLKRGAKADPEPGMTAEVDMPGWNGVLSDSELDALADYLLTLAKPGPKDGDPKDDF